MIRYTVENSEDVLSLVRSSECASWISKCTRTVKLCYNKILVLITSDQPASEKLGHRLQLFYSVEIGNA